MNAFMGDYTAEEQIKLIASSIVELSSKDLSTYASDLAALANAGDYVNSLRKLVEESAVLFGHEEVKSVIGPFNCIGLLICSKTTDADLDTLVLALARAAVAGDIAVHTRVRTQILSNLFNNLQVQSPLRLQVYEQLVQFSQQAGLLVELVSSHEQIDLWLEEWGSSLEQSRSLYKLIADGLAESKLQQLYLAKFLKTYNAEGATVADVKDIAIKYVTNAIRDETCFRTDDMLSLKAVAQLEGSDVFALLTIFSKGSVADYKEFIAAKKAVLESHKLDAKACEEKIMRLTLVSLCTDVSEVAYDDIIKAVQVSEQDLEAFIINAIRVSVIEARMDQMRKTLVVSRAMARTFEHKDWDDIEAKLATLRAGLIEVIMVGTSSRR